MAGTSSPVRCERGIESKIMEVVPIPTPSPTKKTAILDAILRSIRRNEERLFLVLTLIIGVVVGLTIVAFVVLTERVGLRFYPEGAQPWRRLLMPVVGSLLTGYLLYR